MSLPVRTRRTPRNVGDVGAWNNAAAVVEEGDRKRVEEVRKRMKEDEDKGVVPPPRVYIEKWKKVSLEEGPRQIVGVERPQAAAAPAPAPALLPHQRQGLAAPPAEAAAEPILPHLRRPTQIAYHLHLASPRVGSSITVPSHLVNRRPYRYGFNSPNRNKSWSLFA